MRQTHRQTLKHQKEVDVDLLETRGCYMVSGLGINILLSTIVGLSA